MSDPTNQKPLAPIIIAVENKPFREQLEADFRAMGIVPAVIGRATAIWQTPPRLVDEGLVVLDTDDDVAWLVQLVNNLYRSPFHINGATGTICIVSGEAWKSNKQLGWWLVDGHAAVLSVWLRERASERARAGEIAAISRRMWRFHTPLAPEDLEHHLDPFFDSIRESPQDAEAWMTAYDRVMAHNGLHTTRNDVGAALARQAVKLQPENATAWEKLTQALHFCGRHEESEAASREVIRLTAGTARGHLLLGQSLQRLGQDAEARAELEKAVELAGDDDFVRHWARIHLKGL